MLHCENALQCLSHCQIVLCNIERIKSVVGYLRRDNLTNVLKYTLDTNKFVVKRV